MTFLSQDLFYVRTRTQHTLKDVSLATIDLKIQLDPTTAVVYASSLEEVVPIKTHFSFTSLRQRSSILCHHASFDVCCQLSSLSIIFRFVFTTASKVKLHNRVDRKSHHIILYHLASSISNGYTIFSHQQIFCKS